MGQFFKQFQILPNYAIQVQGYFGCLKQEIVKTYVNRFMDFHWN